MMVQGTKYELSANRVREVLNDCLLNGSGEEPVIIEGILNRFGFSPNALSKHKDEILKMLAQLPDEFRADGGGGWSFLNACMDRDGNHWAEHPTMDQLFVLGMAINHAKWLMPREMWEVLPGGMPYVAVKLDEPFPEAAARGEEK